MQRKRRTKQKVKKPEHTSQLPEVLRFVDIKRYFPILLVLLALIGLVNAFRFGGASLDYYTVKNSIDLWMNEGAVQSEESYDNAKSAMAAANILHSSHPLYIELDAQIKEWGLISGFEPEMTIEDAKDSYLEAIKVRPLWPVAYANLAMLKWRQQQFDDELLGYLNKADALGPQKAEVHLLFAQLGLSLYKANHPFYTQIKNQVHERIKKGIHSNATRPQLLLFIKQGEHFKTVCRWLSNDDDLTAETLIGCPNIKQDLN